MFIKKSELIDLKNRISKLETEINEDYRDLCMFTTNLKKTVKRYAKDAYRISKLLLDHFGLEEQTNPQSIKLVKIVPEESLEGFSQDYQECIELIKALRRLDKEN